MCLLLLLLLLVVVVVVVVVVLQVVFIVRFYHKINEKKSCSARGTGAYQGSLYLSVASS